MSKIPHTLKQMAFECYKKLCPHAPKIDTSVEPHQPWPVEKSKTQQAFIEGFKAGAKWAVTPD